MKLETISANSQWKRSREFKSGMIGLVPGEIARINVVNTHPPDVPAGPKPAWVMGWVNPASELIAQQTFSLASGQSAFLDIPAPDDKGRHQIRAGVTVLDDAEGACLVTLEVFARDTGRTTVFMELREAPDALSEESQLALQMAMDRMSRFMATLSNLLKEMAQTAEAIVQNLK